MVYPMKKNLVVSKVFGLCVAAALSPTVFAQSTTSTFDTNTSVESTCKIANGSYVHATPLDTLSTAGAITSEQSVEIKCTKGTANVKVTKNMGLNTVCEQNGLKPTEMLMRSDNGDFLPYKVGARDPETSNSFYMSCLESSLTPVFNFLSTDTQELKIWFLFYAQNPPAAAFSAEARRLRSIAPAGTYTDTITFNIEF